MYVVTGGGTGIGRALAHALAARNQRVLVVGRRAAAIQETESHSSHIQSLVADITTEAGRAEIQARLGQKPLSALIHNAGTIQPISKIENLNPADLEAAFDVNLFAPLRLSQLLLPQLKKGRILHIGTGAAHFPVAAWSAYCTSKAALLMLTRCFQLEMAEPAVSSVMPGIVDTDMVASIRASQHMSAEKLAFFKKLHQSGQLIQPETVALFLTWLLMDVDAEQYRSQEWDIYDTRHHPAWLKAPHKVPTLE